ncbi:hypothetical protein F0U44_03455 [Nocardioides humilatus]|uniref:SecDF P1 head subdomain domain-containing protein n=1 Tax=Nocardioides humilatus TaxID=2607660 RepID=A0A5B1LNL6_9ACTN|nr:hypothetical protein [Nocardioides humilatus]KAA1421370.1 hypothetical protein F0U44_03455 [Nocardioides humilatus]
MLSLSRSRRALGALAALALPLALGACSGDEPKKKADPVAEAASHSSVEFRRVVSSTSGQKQCTSAPDAPSADACAALKDFACPTEPEDLDDDYLLVCGTDAYEREGFLLGKTEISRGIGSAEAGKPESADGWVIDVVLTDDAGATLEQLTEELSGTGRQIALVVDGRVVTTIAPYDTITDGRLRITLGDTTAAKAADLATRLAS